MKKNFKYLALILILSLILPFFPSVNASADISPMPDFPYGQDSFYNVNSGSFALWQVHNSNYISYIQTYTPNYTGSPDPFIIFNETWLSSNNKYYIDYNYIIDSWDINGLHIDGYPVNNNIRVPKPKEDYVEDNVVYATLVFTTDNIWWTNSNGGGIYAYANYYSSGYADPTPTPLPDVPFPDDMPNVDDLYLMCKAVCNYGGNLFETHINPRDYVFVYALENISAELYTSTDDNTWGGIYGVGAVATYSNPLYFYKYDYGLEELTYLGSVNSAYGYNDGGRVYSAGLSFIEYGWNGKTILNTCNKDWNKLGTTRHFAQKPYFFVYWSNGDIVSGENPNESDSPTPTPTTIPTPIPQPTDNPNPSPTIPPDVKVVEPSTHWWDGLVNPIKYIFVPSSDKMMRTYNTFANKFGVQKPTKFEFDANALLRPDNVTWKFKHVSLDGNDNTITEITLVDFQMIDGWLDSSAGQFIIGIVRAVFTLLMWGYLIYIFQKHIATINYTDAHTLIEQSRKGGDSDD